MRFEVELRHAARQDRRRCGRRLDLEVEERDAAGERRRRSRGGRRPHLVVQRREIEAREARRSLDHYASLREHRADHA